MKKRMIATIAVSGAMVALAAFAHEGAHIESTAGTLSSVTNAYYTLSPSDSQYSVPGAIGGNSANCPVGFTYQSATLFPTQKPARCKHTASGLEFKAWVMTDMKEECEAQPTPLGNPCGWLFDVGPSGNHCGHALYVRSGADCTGCGTTASTYVFVSQDGASWIYRKTINNSGASITDTFVETQAAYRYVLLGQPGTMSPPIPRWQHVWTVRFLDPGDCF